MNMSYFFGPPFSRLLVGALALSALIYGLAAIVRAQQPSGSAPRAGSREARSVGEIRAVLEAQVAAWNRGDIEAFMEGYARSPETTFVSGDTVTRGWQVVLDRYRRSYATRERMGTLSFSELEIKLLARDTAIVIGRWQLARAGDEPRERFTLIFRRTGGQWRITHDHTSSAS